MSTSLTVFLALALVSMALCVDLPISGGLPIPGVTGLPGLPGTGGNPIAALIKTIQDLLAQLTGGLPGGVTGLPNVTLPVTVPTVPTVPM